MKTRIGKNLYFHTDPWHGVDYMFTIEPPSGRESSIELKDGFSNANAESWIILSIQAHGDDLVRLLAALKRKAEYLRYSRVCLPHWARRSHWAEDTLRIHGFRNSNGECNLGWVTEGGVRRERRRMQTQQVVTGRKLVPHPAGIKRPAAAAVRQATERQYRAHLASTILSRPGTSQQQHRHPY